VTVGADLKTESRDLLSPIRRQITGWEARDGWIVNDRAFTNEAEVFPMKKPADS
jgi:hypothetical protein